MKRAFLAVLFLALASLASAQAVQTVTVLQNQSLSPVINLAGGQVGLKAPITGLIIIPPAALEATSAEVVIYACADSAGTNCMALYDASGNLVKGVITGGASPTGAVVLDPSQVAGLWWWKFQICAANNSGVSQSTAARVFTILTRPL